jgi:hypothetical protein
MKEKKESEDNNGKDFETRISGPYEIGEFVEMGERSDLADIIKLVHSGATDSEIRELYPTQFFRYYKNIQFIHQQYLEDKFKNTFRILETTYIFGSAGVGKTKYVMEKYGYENVFRITNYERGMFDAYKGQDVIIFEEFRSSLKIEEMLNLLDGYPLQLPCRYNDKTACYTKVYIITNIPFAEQYKNIQTEQPATWQAFRRRVHNIVDFDKHNGYGKIKQTELIPLSPEETDDLPF